MDAPPEHVAVNKSKTQLLWTTHWWSRRSYLLLDLNSYFKNAQYADATVSVKEMRNTQHKRSLLTTLV